MGTLIEFKNEILDSYLSGFFTMLNDILQKGEDLERIKQESAKESSKNSKRDNLIPIYMYCKNLWDKWLCHPHDNEVLPLENRFTVKEFFKNFLFIDSFYRNVYNLLAVNCQHFINLVEGINKNGGVDSTNLYSFLGNLASKTRCLFVAIPDYINLGTVDNEGKMLDTGIRNMEKIFKPIPLKDMRPIQTDNKFVIIYTHEPSKVASTNNGFLKDSFDICDRNGKLTNEAEHLFGGIKLPSEETKRPVGFMGNMDTKAFPVPSFAVAFGGINNHLFQSIDVNMDNPIATEHSINITSQIAQMGSGNSQSIAYQGQDVYPIFSNYAYESKVEMMGNAQIQPLMYYQLMNIPMWKGAYMIFNVQHSITPGNMVTTFRGMKMSKNCVPYLEKWAYPVESPEGLPKLQLVGNDNVSVNNGSNISGGQSVITGESYSGQVMNYKIYGQNPSEGKTAWLQAHCGMDGSTKPTEEQQNKYVTTATIQTRRGTTLTVKLHKDIMEQFLTAWNEILEQPIKFDIFSTSDTRISDVIKKDKNGKIIKRTPSNHCWGVAIDFNPEFNGHISKGYKVKYDSVQSIVPEKLQTNDGDEAKKRINDGIFKENNPNYIVVEIMAKYGFGWGGSYTDYMHFSWFGGH